MARLSQRTWCHRGPGSFVKEPCHGSDTHAGRYEASFRSQRTRSRKEGSQASKRFQKASPQAAMTDAAGPWPIFPMPQSEGALKGIPGE